MESTWNLYDLIAGLNGRETGAAHYALREADAAACVAAMGFGDVTAGTLERLAAHALGTASPELSDRVRGLARSGHAPELLAAARALAAGRLWDVDTRSAGHDSLIDADDPDDALLLVAEHAELTLDEARARGWTATRVISSTVAP